MIVRIARVKVGNRQAPLAKTPAQPGGVLLFIPPTTPLSSLCRRHLHTAP